MTDFANGKIKAYVGPEELGAADCLEDEGWTNVEESSIVAQKAEYLSRNEG